MVIGEKPKVRSYRDLIVWQEAMDLAGAIYALTMSFPADERFGLISQMRRAAKRRRYFLCLRRFEGC